MTGNNTLLRIIDKKTTRIYIIMEYCPRGDLSQLLKKCRKEKDYISEDVQFNNSGDLENFNLNHVSFK